MKWFVKIGRVVMYPALFVLGIYFLSSDAFSNMLSPDDDGRGRLVQIASYFKDADTFNLIFFVITFGLGIGLFVLLSLLFDWIFKRIGKKYPKLDFINADWADLVIQIPTAFAALFTLYLLASNIVIPIRGNRLRVTANEIKQPAPVFVLGTAKHLSSSTPENPKINLYYKYRMDAAIELWNAGKVKYFILSGDGVGAEHKEKYDETKDMTDDLLAAGVPAEKIKIDPNGFNTQNSILRLRAEFKLNQIVLVSQNFQNVRASIMSEYYGIEAMAYDAKGSATTKMVLKEILQSRPKLVIDLLFLNMQPKVKGNGDYQVHEDFDITKSDRHVWTIIVLALLVVVGLVGFGIYRGKAGEERRKYAIKLSAITVGLSIVLFVLVIQIYKNVDIKFIDEVVETISRSVGVQTKKMEVKEELKAAAEEKKREETAPVVVFENAPDEKAPEPVVQEQKTAEQIFSNVASEEPKSKPQQKDLAGVKIVYVKEEAIDPFGNIASDDAQPVKKASVTRKAVNMFKAVVDQTTELKNDGTIYLRLVEPVEIDGVSLPANFLFECSTAVFNGKYLLQANKLGKAVIEVSNYEDGKEGGKITERNQGKKGQVILAAGEQLTMGYL